MAPLVVSSGRKVFQILSLSFPGRHGCSRPGLIYTAQHLGPSSTPQGVAKYMGQDNNRLQAT